MAEHKPGVTKNYKAYIGDGVCADFNGYAIILTTENGTSIQNTVVLESREWETLKEYISKLNQPSFW